MKSDCQFLFECDLRKLHSGNPITLNVCILRGSVEFPSHGFCGQAFVYKCARCRIIILSRERKQKLKNSRAGLGIGEISWIQLHLHLVFYISYKVKTKALKASFGD